MGVKLHNVGSAPKKKTNNQIKEKIENLKKLFGLTDLWHLFGQNIVTEIEFFWRKLS